MGKTESSGMNRRGFIKTTVSAGASLALFPGLSCSDDESAARQQPSKTTERSRVAEVFAPGVVSDDFKYESAHLVSMVEKGERYVPRRLRRRVAGNRDWQQRRHRGDLDRHRNRLIISAGADRWSG